MKRPDELTPEQLARMEAEEAIQDDLVNYLHLISGGYHESNEMIAEIINMALFSPIRGGDSLSKSEVKCAQLQTKCLDWFDLMVERKVHGMPK